MPHLSKWRPINTSSMSLRSAAQSHTFQSTIHSPAWMDLVHRSRGRGLVSKEGLHNLYWDLLSMAISQVEPTLKPYDTYLPPLNSHRVQDEPLNNLDEVHNWMRRHRPAARDDRECGNMEFLCTLSTPAPKRMRYLLDLCKERNQPIYDALSSRPKTCCAFPSPLGKVHAIRRVEGVGGCELSLKNSPRSAASANEFGQPTSWPRTEAPAARRAHVKGRPRPRR